MQEARLAGWTLLSVEPAVVVAVAFVVRVFCKRWLRGSSWCWLAMPACMPTT
ncbi:hypothetical protein LX36DRAFT_659473 [Colletotrichum falcatum]|nr:hypothetical protein LX36DRAFT_659473 [Colletotrichum falcatum]